MSELEKGLKQLQIPSEKIPVYYFTPQQAADHFGITVQGIYKWINDNKVKYLQYKIPGSEEQYLIPKSQFDEETERNRRIHHLRKFKELMPQMKTDAKTFQDMIGDELEELE